MAERDQAFRQLADSAIARGVTPGLTGLSMIDGRIAVRAACGNRQVDPHVLPTSAATIYDLASLTKALVTSVLTMRLCAEGRLSLSDRVMAHLPEFRGDGKAEVTIRHLLAHASGLPAHRPFFERTAGAASQRWAIELLAAAEPLEYRPGTRSVYSDLGFILLGWILERIVGLRLDAQAERFVFAPLRLGSLCFVNLADNRARATLLGTHVVAPTVRCPRRRRLMHGEVHDDNAHAMGGVAGHAGLFGAIDDVGRLVRALLACYHGEARGPAAIVERDLVRAFWTPAGIPGSTWRLGWDGPAARGSQAGERIARHAVGHLAFTGCSLWIDPEQKAVTVVLSNRIHPRIGDGKDFRALRPALHDALLDAAGYRPARAAPSPARKAAPKRKPGRAAKRKPARKAAPKRKPGRAAASKRKPGRAAAPKRKPSSARRSGRR